MVRFIPLPLVSPHLHIFGISVNLITEPIYLSLPSPTCPLLIMMVFLGKQRRKNRDNLHHLVEVSTCSRKGTLLVLLLSENVGVFKKEKKENIPGNGIMWTKAQNMKGLGTFRRRHICMCPIWFTGIGGNSEIWLYMVLIINLGSFYSIMKLEAKKGF